MTRLPAQPCGRAHTHTVPHIYEAHVPTYITACTACFQLHSLYNTHHFGDFKHCNAFTLTNIWYIKLEICASASIKSQLSQLTLNFHPHFATARGIQINCLSAQSLWSVLVSHAQKHTDINAHVNVDLCKHIRTVLASCTHDLTPQRQLWAEVDQWLITTIS